MRKGNYRKSQVLMKTSSGYEHMFESLTEAASYAKANAWTMSIKMEVFGYFEDKNGNKYYRQDKMKTKNVYTTKTPKEPKERKKRKTAKTYWQKRIVVDGILFESIKKAEEHFGIKPDTFGQALRHGQTHSKGHVISYANELPQFKTNKPLEIENLKPLTEVKQPIVDYKTKKEEKVSIIVDSEDPAIKAINDKIVETLKKAGVYDEIYKLSKAIQKLSK